MAFLGNGVAKSAAEKSELDQYYVDVHASDCVNTYTLKLIVSATRNGKAFGEFEGNRYYLQQYKSKNICNIKLLRYNQDGTPGERTQYECMYENPLGHE